VSLTATFWLSLKIVADKEREVPWGDPVTVYPYHDEHGVVLYEMLRFERHIDGRKEKKLRPRLPGASRLGIGDVRRVLYRLPEVQASPLVFVVEGEKDVETLRAHGFVATCNVFGAKKWQRGYADALAGREVIIWPDADGPGIEHAHMVAESLYGRASKLSVLEIGGAGIKDATDWFNAGHSKVELIDLIDPEEVTG
jgi:hypothetical protein